MNTTILLRTTIIFAAGFCSVSGLSQTIPGIPEPGLVMYGTVRNTIGAVSYRLTSGTLIWRVVAPNKTINITLPLTNLVDQFSYVVQIPYETVLQGFTLSPNALQLTTGPSIHTRSATVNGVNANLVAPTQPTFTFSAQDRGRIERVDLTVSIPFTDADHDGLPDDWERQYFGHTGFGASDDPDRDGVSNLAELQAGSNPNEFRLVSVQPAVIGGLTLQWVSQDYSSFSLQRSSDLSTGFSTIRMDIPASGLDMTAFRDSAATNRGPYFYRVGGQ
jgi:hypothetical protein